MYLNLLQIDTTQSSEKKKKKKSFLQKAYAMCMKALKTCI